MPSFDLNAVFENLPMLKSFWVQNVDEFKKDQFLAVYQRFMSYNHLNKLGLELLSFDIEEVKEEFFQIIRTHYKTLKTLLLGRNKISNAFMKDMCNSIKELNNIELIDLTHLKEVSKIDWKDYLESLSMLSA